ncbi:MAG: autotransporter domain-containing protein [Burkholderiaceae bacterium]|nr:autotransporter domain-containing protein [Burkholderiaceae bacterium]
MTHETVSLFPGRKRGVIALAIATLLTNFCIAARAQSAAELDLIDDGTAGRTFSWVRGLDASGNVAVGTFGTASSFASAFRWTAATGWVDLGRLNSGDSAQANGVSADGSVVIGSAADGALSNLPRAFRWTSAGLVSLGTLNGLTTSSSWGNAVNAAGDVVVGTDSTAGGQSRAFRWTQSTGSMADLGVLPGGSFSTGSAVNAAGDVVVGQADDALGNSVAYRWTAAGNAMTSLGLLSGYVSSEARGINAAGDVVVGYVMDAAFETQAFLWSSTGGMQGLGGANSVANAVNAAGTVVVGQMWDGASSAMRAARWTQASGMQTVEQWLAGAGLAVGPSQATGSAYAVNADGTVVGGVLDNGYAFIARVSPVGTGLMNVDDYQRSLSATASTALQPLWDEDLVLHGAHGQPLRGLPAAGRSVLWTAADLGTSDRPERDHRQGVTEIGISHGVDEASHVKLALGMVRSTQQLHLDGRAHHRSTYVVPEFIRRMPSGLVLSASGYYARGSSRIARSYLNAGLPDSSVGEPGIRTGAVRLRVDAPQAFGVAGWAATPYGSLTASRTRTDAYTESGGGFPARWSARAMSERIVRLGVDGERTMGADARLTLRLEAARRVGGTAGAVVSGEALGLFAFDRAVGRGAPSWMRAGAGMNWRLGEGWVDASVNVTTAGGATTGWVAANYRIGF